MFYINSLICRLSKLLLWLRPAVSGLPANPCFWCEMIPMINLRFDGKKIGKFVLGAIYESDERVCVCVSVRERKREREKLITHWHTRWRVEAGWNIPFSFQNTAVSPSKTHWCDVGGADRWKDEQMDSCANHICRSRRLNYKEAK